MQRLHLGRGRDAATRRRHPWLFSRAAARTEGSASDGLVEAVSTDGSVLARGFASPRSPICARFWTFGDAPLDAALVASRVRSAVDLRGEVVPEDTDGYRVVNAEGAQLPGLVVDRYGDVLVVQATTEGTERARPLWLPPLSEAFPRATILQRNDLPSRAGEGLPTEDLLLQGPSMPEHADFREHGMAFRAEIRHGQKTGFFLDQRESRDLVRRNARGRNVLNLFSYSGAFGVAALAGGARRVAQVDASAAAIQWARDSHARNGQSLESTDLIVADVFDDLRARVAGSERWDVVVTDPPAFAKKSADVERACRGYKDVNRLALKLLAPGGRLLACSCSGPVDAALFQKVLFAASLDAGVSVRLLERRGAGADHPVSLDCPEGEYLKAFWLAAP